MGNAKIYYYPPTGARETTLAEIDLGSGLSFIDDWQLQTRESSLSYSGQPAVAVYTSWQAVEVRIDVVKDSAVARDLETLEVALKRGGIIALAEDSDKAVAAFASTPPAQGNTELTLLGNQWGLIEPAAQWTTGDLCLVQGPSPGGKRDTVTATAAHPGTKLSALNSPLRFDYASEPWALVKHRGFWPFLMLPPTRTGDNLLQPINNRLAWSWRATLYEPPVLLDVAGRLYADHQWEAAPADGSGISPYVLLGQSRVPTGRAGLGGVLGTFGPSAGGSVFDQDPSFGAGGSVLGGRVF